MDIEEQIAELETAIEILEKELDDKREQLSEIMRSIRVDKIEQGTLEWWEKD